MGTRTGAPWPSHLLHMDTDTQATLATAATVHTEATELATAATVHTEATELATAATELATAASMAATAHTAPHTAAATATDTHPPTATATATKRWVVHDQTTVPRRCGNYILSRAPKQHSYVDLRIEQHVGTLQKL